MANSWRAPAMLASASRDSCVDCALFNCEAGNPISISLSHWSFIKAINGDTITAAVTFDYEFRNMALRLLMGQLFGINFNVSQFFGGTSMLITVGVLLDTMRQMESHLLMRHYDGFLKKGRLKGRF